MMSSFSGLDQKKLKLPFILPWPGMPSPVWAAQAKYLQSIVKAHGLKPIELECKLGGAALRFVPPWWKYGGIREAHIHAGDQLYALNSAQWKIVVDKLALDYKLAIKNASTIPFEAMVDVLSSAAVAKDCTSLVPAANRGSLVSDAVAKPAAPNGKPAAARPKAVPKPKPKK